MSKKYMNDMHSLLRGAASISSVSGHFSVKSPKNAEDVDIRALASDWEAVGRDISGAIYEYAQQI